MRIDVYDFDGTIYDGDSTVDFTRFCLRRHPGVLAGLPSFWASLLLAAGRRSLTQFKSVLFGEMARRFNLETEAELSEGRRPCQAGQMVFDRPRDLPIVIASASPEFELQYAAKLLGVPTLIGTKYDVWRAHWQELQGRGKTAPHRAEYRPV
ncbi:MAG: HAD family hydrolase [Christensenellales bacterium]